MIRLLVAVLLLHHIEGVCKPWSWATQAARAVAQTLVDAVSARDTDAAQERAQAARTAATQRAIGRGIERQPKPPVIDTMTRPNRGRPAIDPPADRGSVTDQLRQHQRDTA